MGIETIVIILVVAALISGALIALTDRNSPAMKQLRRAFNRLEYSDKVCVHCGAKTYYDYTVAIYDTETRTPRIYLRKELCSNCSIQPHDNEVVLTRKMYLNRNNPYADQPWLTDIKIEDLLPTSTQELESLVEEMKKPDDQR
jgi:hypothetical protein